MPWAPNYVDASEARSYLRITDSVDDAVIQPAITAASRSIDRFTNRQFGQVDSAQERTYTPYRDGDQWVVEIDDLMDDSGVVVEQNGQPVGGFSFLPVNAAATGWPYTRIVFTGGLSRQSVTVTAMWGWTEVPEPVKQATLLQMSRLFARRGAPFGVAGSPDAGSEMRLMAKLDPDVVTTLGPFTRWWGVA